jgi:hypothetical protein
MTAGTKRTTPEARQQIPVDDSGRLAVTWLKREVQTRRPGRS